MISGDHHHILTAVSGAVDARLQADVAELTAVLAWADLHTDEPAARPGGDRLARLGGDGTPAVSELCWAELAIARKAGVIATRNLAADALDLRHRLPLLFEDVQALKTPVWVARKIAAMTRPLSVERAVLVDTAVAAAWQLPAGKLLQVAEAKVIEADLEAHRRRIKQDQTRTGVWRSRPRTGDRLGGEAGACEPATGRLAAQLPIADLVEIDCFLDDLADKLATNLDPNAEQPTRDQLRAQALALMADPAAVLRLLHGPDAPALPEKPRRDAVLYFHVTAATLRDAGVARCEDLGPLLLQQVTTLLGLRNVRLQPVLDLNAVQTAHAYEHPPGCGPAVSSGPAATPSRTPPQRAGGWITTTWPRSTRSVHPARQATATTHPSRDSTTASRPTTPAGR
ncbi:MAG TPA: hypothetical protein VJ872_16620 [Nocardioides sp.]|nr:hypothetical protein [Nocardioides sp.]